MKTHLIALCVALCASVCGYGQSNGDHRIQYYQDGNLITTWLPHSSSPYIWYHNGGPGAATGMTLGDSLTVVSSRLEANWLYLVGKPTALSQFTNDMGFGAVPARSFASASRTLNSAFQPSTTRDAIVSYSVDVSTSATLLGGQTGTVFLEYANDSGFTSGVTEVARFVNGNSVSLAIAITVTQNVTGTLTGVVPAGKYVRIRTANTSGVPTFNYRSGQEVLL